MLERNGLTNGGANIDSLTNAIHIDVVVLASDVVVLVGRSVDADSILATRVDGSLGAKLTRDQYIWIHHG